MAFQLVGYVAPDFSEKMFMEAPDAVLAPAPKDRVAPLNYHATTIYPEYFKVNGQWILAGESRMDCVAVYEDGSIYVREFRNLKKGDLVFLGRTENCEEGIFVHAHGFDGGEGGHDEAFAFRQRRSRETAFSKDYDNIYELLRHEKEHGYVVWVMGPACAFDSDSREAFSKLVMNGYVDAVLAGNALATHDLEGAYMNTALGQNIYTCLLYTSSITGMAFLTGAGGKMPVIGIVTAIASSLTYGGYLIANEKGPANDLPIEAKLFYVSLPGTVIFAVLSAATGTLQAPAGGLSGWALLIGGSGLFTVSGYFLMMYGISRLGASTAAFVSMLEPIVSVVFGTIWFDDPVTLGIVAGGCLVVTSILFITFDGFLKSRAQAAGHP